MSTQSPSDPLPGGTPPPPHLHIRTNGLAITSLVLGLVGIVFFVFFAIPSILAMIFGFSARTQIRQANGWQTGDGMAMAGIILGAVETVIFAIAVATGNFHFRIG